MSFPSVLRNRFEKKDQALASNPSEVLAINQAHITVSRTKVRIEKRELEEANILYGFLENRYAQMVGVNVLGVRFTDTR